MSRAHHRRRPLHLPVGFGVALVVAVGVLVAMIVLLATSPRNEPARSLRHLPRAASTVEPRSVPSSVPSPPTTSGAGNGPSAVTTALVLAGKVVGIDPGHNGGNSSDPAQVDAPVWNGREQEACDTTGAETDTGFTEAQFTFDVAQYLIADLQAEGARVVTTRATNDGVGPCVDRRSAIINAGGADVAIDVHADGGPANGRGVTILEPVADGPNNGVIASSQALGTQVLRDYLSVTGMPVSTYDGTNGVAYRQDLAGLNLTTVPKVLIECGNMRNPVDAALLVAPSFQQLAAQAMTRSITSFLTGR